MYVKHVGIPSSWHPALLRDVKLACFVGATAYKVCRSVCLITESVLVPRLGMWAVFMCPIYVYLFSEPDSVTASKLSARGDDSKVTPNLGDFVLTSGAR